MNGFLLIDKPSGISSAQCVYFLRKILKRIKIGHCGTLDPLATGVLPICIGEATKFSGFVSDQIKRYEVKILFGLETDSGDITGKEVALSEVNFTLNDLKSALQSFIGESTQIPPMFSAKKKDGKPLYYWARKGVYLNREPVHVSIKNINLKSKNLVNKEAVIEVTCSKGTYIRVLIESLGRSLGTRATVLELRRTRLGLIKDKDTISLEFTDKSSYLKKLVNCEDVLNEFPKILLDKEQTKKIRKGQQVDYNARQEKEGLVRLYEEEGSFIGIGSVDSLKKVSPRRLLSKETYSA
tara:strand:- start:2690 stop:3577 length:888 start_codon:yes stop_codon:yes gene_type:complete